MPVIASTSMDSRGMPVNINADEVAFSVACELPADSLVFVSDIPGVLKGEEVVRVLGSAGATEAVEDGTITGGMIPKVHSSLKALERGVGSVKIGGYRENGDLSALISGDIGTTITGN